jgi:serine/threonine-protein kinase RsbW
MSALAQSGIDMPSRLSVPAELSNLAAIRCFVDDVASALGCDHDAIDDMILAVDEHATNIIVHGYCRQPGSIEVEVEKKGKSLVVRVRDRAPFFDPTEVPPPDLTVPLEQRRLGGLGIHLIRNSVDRMSYRVTANGSNELTLAKQCC